MEALKKRIDEMFAFVKSSNYYEALGVEPETPSPDITKAFRSLAKDWHVDRFSSVDLGEHKQTLQVIFATLNTAHVTLSNKQKRTEYDHELSGGSEDASHAIGLILEASAEFTQGKNMLRRGSFRGAIEKFRSAVDKQPEEAEYQAYLYYCEYLLCEKDSDGIVVNTVRSAEIYNELDKISKTVTEKDWLYLFMGSVAEGLDRERTARNFYAEALVLNPGNHEAQRKLRLIKMRKDSKSKGFFSKLFKK